MKSVLFSSLMVLSFSAFAGQKSTEPLVNFDGVKVGITKTCLVDSQTLRTKEPVKMYAMVDRGGRRVSTYVGSKVLETSVEYEKLGKCISKMPKTGTCLKRAPSVTKSYELDGTYKVLKTRQMDGKFTVIVSSKIVPYSVQACE
jgi:hypothetical protein